MEPVTVGVDIGSTASKIVILRGREIIASVIGPSSTNPSKTAKAIFDEALKQAGVREKDVARAVGTGYGRAKVPFASEVISEISCHGRGAHFHMPSVGTVIDIGGQDSKAIAVDNYGALLDFAMNDKCAAGTGRFLEAMAKALETDIHRFSELHFEEGEPCMIGSMCSVFAESEVINLINDEVPLPRIVKGIHLSLATRVASLARRTGLFEDIVVTGGVAKNRGVLDALSQKLRAPVKPLPADADPQLVGALGAALIAYDNFMAEQKAG